MNPKINPMRSKFVRMVTGQNKTTSPDNESGFKKTEKLSLDEKDTIS